MDIEQAKLLKVGDSVRCPPDREYKGFIARVIHIGKIVCTNNDGVKFLWATVDQPYSTWPTNRISKV